MPAAARIGDMHSCPLNSGGVPHHGGAIIGPGISSVLIAGKPAAVTGDAMICNGSIDKILTGSATVFINGRPAARINDRSGHGGIIITGATDVQIG